MNTILVVEDDILLNKTLSYNLMAEGYEVISSTSLADARAKYSLPEITLCVLDVNLPDGSGFDLCREIKGSRDTPVIFLTANDMESDMLKGYELGAEDYVTKPFPMSVFKKKVEVLMRRQNKDTARDIYSDGYLTIDFSGLTARLDEQTLILSPTEYKTLKILTSNPKTVLTRQLLLEKLWDAEGNFVDENTLTSVISRIRSKIESKDRPYIKTVYGMGYTWTGESK